jgi:DNA-binding response OmpR family regulator
LGVQQEEETQNQLEALLTTTNQFQKPHIMLVEDDASLAVWVADYLTTQGFDVTIADNGIEAVNVIKVDNPDLVLLDLSLPGKDGFDVCKEARLFYSNPILIMTARVDETDEVLGLELGADDYITKPVRPRALLARIRRLLKRTNVQAAESPGGILNFGDLTINPNTRTTRFAEQTIKISSNEFEVLLYLAEHAGEIVSRDTLLKEIRGIEYDGFDRSMDVLVSRIRKKLNDEENAIERIKTVWGKGYLFVTDAWQSPK